MLHRSLVLEVWLGFFLFSERLSGLLTKTGLTAIVATASRCCRVWFTSQKRRHISGWKAQTQLKQLSWQKSEGLRFHQTSGPTHACSTSSRKERLKKKKISHSAPRNFQTSNTSSVNHSFSIPNSWTPYLTITYRLAPPENRSLLVHWVITHNWGITRDWLDLKETQTCVRRMHLRSMMRWTQDLEPIWGGVGCYSSKHHFSETFSRWKRYSCEVRTKILMTHCQQVSRCQ